MTKIIINKIIFYSFNKIKFSKLIKKNGLYVFPAAPALTKIDKDFEYKDSLINSDYVFLDSGFLCLFLLFFKGVRVKKLSGLKFLRKLLSYLRYKKKKLYLIDPNSLHSNKNFIFLKKLNISKVESYVAPKYKSKISDKKLLGKINKYKPDFILINIGGGVQEKLGYYLKKNVRFKTKIICTGAAIAFLTGLQAKIPKIIDIIYLGWFFRIIFSPSQYFIRYFKSFKLLFILLRSKIKIINS